jgi:cell division septation protein DedD
VFTIALLLAAYCALCAAGSALAAEPRWGRLYTISGSIPVRENPTDDALKVRELKAGQRVRVDFQDAGWAAVFDPKEPVRSELKALGYVRLDELRFRGAAATARASSIEVRKPQPDAKPEVLVDGKPDTTVAKASKALVNADKPDAIEKAGGAAPRSAPKAQARRENSFGEIRVPDRDLAVRASRTPESEFNKLIRPGQRVRVDFWEEGWFAVFDPAEKKRDLAKAWGYSRDKYLVPESAYAGPPPGSPPAVPASAAAPAPVKADKPAPTDTPASPGNAKLAEEPKVGYAVVERAIGHGKPPVVNLRVRLELSAPPSQEVLRKVVREIWKAERKKDEDLQLELLLMGMDAHGLSYATARFHADGRIREFWWREVVLDNAEK